MSNAVSLEKKKSKIWYDENIYTEHLPILFDAWGGNFLYMA